MIGRPTAVGRTLLVALVVGASTAFAWSAAEAQGFRWLRNSPVAAFTDEDFDVLRAATRDAMEEGKEGQTFGWYNEVTGASGAITLREDSELDGMRCRRAKFYNSADGVTGTSIHRLCRTADGSWRVAPPGTGSKSGKPDAAPAYRVSVLGSITTRTPAIPGWLQKLSKEWRSTGRPPRS